MAILILPLMVLTVLSLLASGASLLLGIFIAQSVSPALWAIPCAFGLTFFYHAFILLLRRLTFPNPDSSESPRWTRRFSMFAMGGGLTLTIIWTGVFILALYLVILQWSAGLPIPQDQKRIRTLLIETCVLAFLEAALMGATVFWSHKEWKRAQYPSKWQWTVNTASGSKWSINTGTSHNHSTLGA